MLLIQDSYAGILLLCIYYMIVYEQTYMYCGCIHGIFISCSIYTYNIFCIQGVIDNHMLCSYVGFFIFYIVWLINSLGWLHTTLVLGIEGSGVGMLYVYNTMSASTPIRKGGRVPSPSTPPVEHAYITVETYIDNTIY